MLKTMTNSKEHLPKVGAIVKITKGVLKGETGKVVKHGVKQIAKGVSFLTVDVEFQDTTANFFLDQVEEV